MGHVGGPERAVYCGSKHAIEGINKSMAIEFGAVCYSGQFDLSDLYPHPTELNPHSATQKNLPGSSPRSNLIRVGQIEDIMGAVQFLASDASALVTGTSLLIDGGWTAD